MIFQVLNCNLSFFHNTINLVIFFFENRDLSFNGPKVMTSVSSTGHRAQGTGHRAQGTGHKAQGTGHRLCALSPSPLLPAPRLLYLPLSLPWGTEKSVTRLSLIQMIQRDKLLYLGQNHTAYNN
jgi:hypothetical protein